MTIFKISNRKKIENYVLNLGKKPFSTKSAAAETDVPVQTVRNVLRKMEISGKIKVISHDKKGNYYIKIDRRDFSNQSYKPNIDKLRKILSFCREKSVSEIARDTGITRTTVEDYLNVLYVEGYIVIIDTVASKTRLYVQTAELEHSPQFQTIDYYKKKAEEMRSYLIRIVRHPSEDVVNRHACSNQRSET